MARVITTAVVSLGAVAGASGQTRFEGVGVLPGYTRSAPSALSADGSTAVGHCYTGTSADFRPFRWTRAGIQDLGVLPGGSVASAIGVNADGSVVVGRCTVAGVVRAFRWTAAGGMAQLPGPPGAQHAVAMGVSADGAVVAGTATRISGGTLAFRWTAAGGAAWLEPPVGWSGAEGWAISANGQTIAGKGPMLPPAIPFRAVGTVSQSLGPIPMGLDTHAVGLSGDGGVVVASLGTLAYSRGYKWTPAGGLEALPAPGAFTWSAHAANHDGSVIGGGLSPFPDSDAYIWSEQVGNVVLAQHLGGLGVNLTGWTLSVVLGVSADGRTFTGRGTHQTGPGESREEAWVASLGSACYPDCNDDGALTVQDFGCFQTRFVAGDPYADCNGDGVGTVADFGCFQNAFVAGCP